MQHILPFNFIPMVLEYCFFQWIFSPYKEKKKKKKNCQRNQHAP